MKDSNPIFLQILPQECGGDSRFNGDTFMSQGFQQEFGNAAVMIATAALELIIEERVKRAEGADYLQTFCFGDVRFWCIYDITHITFLLPEEY